jgi:hypothetical protein
MFFLGFVVGFFVCSMLCIEMLQRKGMMNKDGEIVDLSNKDNPNSTDTICIACQREHNKNHIGLRRDSTNP